MPLEHFSSDGVDIAFLDSGEGDPILLIHGFASNHVVNWGATGWIDTLKRDGRRVVAMDVRGHGKSAKLHDPAAYPLPLLAADAARLLAHLGILRADVMGYSMGARITVAMALAHQDRMRSMILGGMGYAMVEGMQGEDAIVAALEAPSLDDVSGEPGRAYRKFAEPTGSDTLALAA
jgi:pimeloyl-ACP methyl ester carboxylesterase